MCRGRVPDWSGKAELEEDVELAAGQERGWFGRNDESGAENTAVRELPLVSIGAPEVWPLRDVYPLDKMPATLRASLDTADFHLVRLACSFRPKRQEVQVEWARFGVTLLPDDRGRLPIAYDMHPLQLTTDVKRNVKVSLSPTVKFQELEVGVGSADFGFEYTELQPVISASGIGESEPSWDFQSATGAQLIGSKWMHLLVRTPREMTTVNANLRLVADVMRGAFRLPVFARTGREAAEPLTVRLW